MRYVYLLQSEAVTGQRYVGVTSDLKQRLADHNAGKSPHTSKRRDRHGILTCAHVDKYLRDPKRPRGNGAAQSRNRAAIGDAGNGQSLQLRDF
jgi:hypothetical protein